MEPLVPGAGPDAPSLFFSSPVYLNASIPHFEACLRPEILHGHDVFVGGDDPRVAPAPCIVFGVASIEGRALGFHVMLSNGAVVWRVPIHALAADPAAKARPLEDLELWDCFSYHVGVEVFDYLAGMRVVAKLKDGTRAPGRYRFTVDWAESAMAENAGDTGHKCGHFIELDEGNFALLPNNRLCFHCPAWVDEPWIDQEQPPRYQTIRRTWSSEASGTRWRTSDAMLYDVQAEDGTPSPA